MNKWLNALLDEAREAPVVPTPDTATRQPMIGARSGACLPAPSVDSRLHFSYDPSPDFADDSARWTRLLGAAYSLETADEDGVLPHLYWARLLGCRLEVDSDGLRFDRGEQSPEEFADVLRECVEPFGDEIAALLEEVARQDRTVVAVRRLRGWLASGTLHRVRTPLDILDGSMSLLNVPGFVRRLLESLDRGTSSPRTLARLVATHDAVLAHLRERSIL